MSPEPALRLHATEPAVPTEQAPTFERLHDLAEALQGERFIRQAELAARLAVSEATFHRLKSAKRIGPRPIKLGGVKYLLSEVEAWFQNRRPDGQLYDAKTWPAVWASLNRA